MCIMKHHEAVYTQYHSVCAKLSIRQCTLCPNLPHLLFAKYTVYMTVDAYLQSFQVNFLFHMSGMGCFLNGCTFYGFQNFCKFYKNSIMI